MNCILRLLLTWCTKAYRRQLITTGTTALSRMFNLGKISLRRHGRWCCGCYRHRSPLYVPKTAWYIALSVSDCWHGVQHSSPNLRFVWCTSKINRFGLLNFCSKGRVPPPNSCHMLAFFCRIPLHHKIATVTPPSLLGMMELVPVPYCVYIFSWCVLRDLITLLFKFNILFCQWCLCVLM
jgi:hypothetical protein